MQVSINGTVVAVVAGSLDVEDAIGQRSTCQFDVRDDAGTAVYLQGEPVVVLADDSSALFTGFVDNATQVQRDDYGMGLIHNVVCVDNHYLADKRIAAASYTSQTAAYIVNDLITTYLSAEGVTAGTIETGPTINSAIFNYVPVSQAIDALAEQADFWWLIDSSKRLQFRSLTAVTAPWTADGTRMDVSSVKVARGNSQYRNGQYMLGGTDTTATQTETRNGDGTTRSWAMGFPLATVPTIQVSRAGGAYTAQTVGIKGIDTGKDFYWSKGDNVISQDSTGTVLAGGGTPDTIQVQYTGQYAVVALSRDNAEVASQQSLEGGTTTGYVEDVDVDASITSSAAAFQSANAKLTRFSQQCSTVTFDTLDSGLAPGQLLTVNLPAHNLNNVPCLVEKVSTKDNGDYTVYSITAVKGPANTDWVAFFSKLTQRPLANVDKVSVGQNSTLVILEQINETWTWTETVTETVYSCPVPSTTLYPSTSLNPC